MRHTNKKKKVFLFHHSSQMSKHCLFHVSPHRGCAMTPCPAERCSGTEMNASEDTLWFSFMPSCQKRRMFSGILLSFSKTEIILLVRPKSTFLVTQLIWWPNFRKQGDTLRDFKTLNNFFKLFL